ncbi:ATP-binding protein [Pseudactinotalea sp. HY158]|uniref:AAA family ATPase n=1 Tax=Pseudactinotalea sp. HY158 TaxID=2654547 RepID=UPI00129CA550|nr:ATP-binding protein [Pseudactinotalea sp. HY158]QGH68194.1 AAA family ATPase [Pseudactinotalea sp. HY158]
MRAPTVLLTCGSAGSGKTTYARAREAEGYAMLSMDSLVRSRFGVYGVDIPVERFQEYNDAVRPELERRLVDHLRAGRDVVLDSPLPRRADRDAYKDLVLSAGGRWRLVYFDVPPAERRRRVLARRERGTDPDAFPATDELLELFHANFEPPHGEGEEVVHP